MAPSFMKPCFFFLPFDCYILLKKNYTYILYRWKSLFLHYKQYIDRMKDLNQLKLVLVKHKKTNKWLAEQLGVNQTTVSKWCTNTTQPDLATLKRISELLKVSASEIINFD